MGLSSSSPKKASECRDLLLLSCGTYLVFLYQCLSGDSIFRLPRRAAVHAAARQTRPRRKPTPPPLTSYLNGRLEPRTSYLKRLPRISYLPLQVFRPDIKTLINGDQKKGTTSIVPIKYLCVDR